MYYANTKFDAAAIGFDDQFIYEELDLEHAFRQLPTEQILNDEALVAFKEWQTMTGKIEY